MSNPAQATYNLAAAIPPKVRRYVYAAYVIAGVVTGCAQAYIAAVGMPQPDPVTGALGVLAFLAVPITGLAAVNTPEGGAVELEAADGDFWVNPGTGEGNWLGKDEQGDS